MRTALAVFAAGLMLAAVPARAQTDADAPAPAKTRTSCDLYGRCFEFGGPNDTLIGNGVAIWRHVSDPLALATGTPGDPVVEVADD